MKPPLVRNVAGGHLRHMRRRLIHDHHQVAVGMIGQHLTEEVDHLDRGDSLLVKAEEKVAGFANGRHGCDTSPFPRHPGLRRLAAGCPGLAEESGERDVRFILKIQDSTVFSDCPTDSRDLRPNPLLPGLLIDFIVRALWLLVRQICIAKPPPDGILGHFNVVNLRDDCPQPSHGPQIGLVAIV